MVQKDAIVLLKGYGSSTDPAADTRKHDSAHSDVDHKHDTDVGCKDVGHHAEEKHGPPHVPANIGSNRKEEYRGGITWRVMMATIVAANAGLIYGYYIGVTGGAETFPSWQGRFFPNLLIPPENETSAYCKYDDQLLGLFTSSLFLAGAISSLAAGWLTDKRGRRFTIVLGGGLSIIGIVLQCTAYGLGQLIFGRVILGIGVGFSNQAVPMFLSEMAPFQHRGAINNMFQTATTLGIFVGQIATWRLSKFDYDWNWRVAFALAGLPSLIMTLGTAMLDDSPSGLIERGFLEEGRAVLAKIRGTDEVEAEFLDTVDAAEASHQVANPWLTIITRPYLPQLVIAIFMPLGQQLPGIDSIMFYSPQIFETLGLVADTALLYAVILSGLQWLCTLVAVATVDRFGRRLLLIEGGCQMAVALILAGAVLAGTAGSTESAVTSGVLFLMCIFVAGFAWSWGPLGWLVPTEVQPLETRSAGMAITTSVSLAVTFLYGQTFPAMLCSMEYGVFFYFAAWTVFFTLFVIFFLPETKNVPLEEVEGLFFAHRIWGRLLAGVKTERDLAQSELKMEQGNNANSTAARGASVSCSSETPAQGWGGQQSSVGSMSVQSETPAKPS